MGLRRLARYAPSRRLAAVTLVGEGAKELLDGRRDRGLKLLAIAALAYRSTWAGIAVEIGFRLLRRYR